MKKIEKGDLIELFCIFLTEINSKKRLDADIRFLDFVNWVFDSDEAKNALRIKKEEKSSKIFAEERRKSQVGKEL
jgi:hypothetical protein